MDNRFLTKVQSNLLDKIIIFSVSKKKNHFSARTTGYLYSKKNLAPYLLHHIQILT